MSITRVQVCHPPSAAAAIRGRAGQVPWPARLAEATGWLMAQPDTQAWLVDSVASGESEAGCLTRIAELVTDVVAIAAAPETIDGDLPLIAVAARPVIVLWSGDARAAELFLELPNVRAVVCGEPELGLLAACALDAPTVYPADPLPDLDSLPRPYRDYSVHRYRLPLPGLPDGPQLVQQAGRGPGRRHGAAWLLDDLAFCQRAYPRLTHLLIQDTDLASEAGYLADLGTALAGLDWPWAVRLTLDGPTDPAAWEALTRAAAVEVRLARAPESAELAGLHRLAQAGVALSLAALDAFDLGTLGDELGAAETLTTEAVEQPLHCREPRLLVVGQHLPIYMPPWLVAGAREAGLNPVAVDLRSPQTAIGLLNGAGRQDVVLVDRGGLSADLVAALRATTVLYSPEVLPTLAATDPHAEKRYAEYCEAADAYDHVILHDAHALEFLLDRGHRNLTAVVPLPYSPTFHRDLGLERDIDLLFVGNVSQHRTEWIRAIEAGGVKVTAAQAWGDDYIQLLNRAKLVLNLHFTALPNTELRVVEAMACGAVVVTEPLTPGSELARDDLLLVIDRASAAESIRALLANDAVRQQVAAHAKAFVAEHYTARHVVERIWRKVVGQ
ncbi:MAG: glycosyltransferase family 1 protein [Armatimonadetes bacterium]|nr:glycosyltransferase family 1 protein [Armatimonadota bacterium]